MNAVIFLMLAATFLAGIVLVLLGRRGRKLNNHPQCCWCGFDLEGVYPAHVTCPECGAGLKRDRAVRIGVRKRLGSLIMIGVALTLIPLTPIAIAVYAGATGVNLNEYKPVWLLLFEGRNSRPGQSGAIAQELLSRMQLKTVDAETVGRIAAVALDLQENAKGTWTEDWGDVIEQARADRVLNDDDLKRFRRNSMVITFRARVSVRAGDPLPVEAALTESRCGSASSMAAQLVSAKASLDGKVISRPALSQRRAGLSAGLFGLPGSTVMDRVPVATWWITGSKSPMAFGGRRQAMACWDYRVPKDVTPGRHELEVHLSAQVDDTSGYGGAAGVFGGDSRRNGRLFTFKAVIDVLPADAPALPPVTLTPEAEEQLRVSLQPSSVVGYSQERVTGKKGAAATTVQITFNFGDLPAPIAHRVIVVVDGKEHHAGQLASGSAASGDPTTAWYPGMDEHTRMVYASIPKLDLKKTKVIDIILRPDYTVAARMLDPAGVYGEELVYKGVVITDQSQAYFGASQSAPAAAEETESDPENGAHGGEPEAAPDE